jgi:hypothetical protein
MNLIISVYKYTVYKYAVICAMRWGCSVHSAVVLCSYMCHEMGLFSTECSSIMQLFVP